MTSEGTRMKITKLCILGERVSGTCFVQKLIAENIGLQAVSPFGHKHYFQEVNPRIMTDDTLFVFISRDIIEWLNSFMVNTFHADMSIRNCTAMKDFLRMEWKCIMDSTSGTPQTSKDYGNEMMCERDPETGGRFENVIKMRNSKMRHFLSIHENVEHFVHLRYEDVRDSPEEVLNEICSEFGLTRRGKFVDVKTIRGKGKVPYSRKIYPDMEADDLHFVMGNIDHSLEEQLGYL